MWNPITIGLILMCLAMLAMTLVLVYRFAREGSRPVWYKDPMIIAVTVHTVAVISGFLIAGETFFGVLYYVDLPAVYAAFPFLLLTVPFGDTVSVTKWVILFVLLGGFQWFVFVGLIVKVAKQKDLRWKIVPPWRWQPPRPAGHCQQCGYNLTGNVSGRCPECGKKITP